MVPRRSATCIRHAAHGVRPSSQSERKACGPPANQSASRSRRGPGGVWIPALAGRGTHSHLLGRRLGCHGFLPLWPGIWVSCYATGSASGRLGCLAGVDSLTCVMRPEWAKVEVEMGPP
eukprot:7022801-Pyramimonas_sp.AAC.1